MSTTPLKLYLMGFNKRGQNLVETFISRLCKDQCCIVYDKKQAESFLVNMDSIGIEKQLASIKNQYAQTPIIHVALYEIDCTPHYFIRKPLKVEHFWAIVNEIDRLPQRKIPQEKLVPTIKMSSLAIEKEKAAKVFKQLDAPKPIAEKAAHDINEEWKAEFVGDRSDIDLSNETNLAAIYFEPQRYFLFHFQQALNRARNNRSTIKLRGLGQTAILCPSSDCIYTSKSDKNVRSLCVVALYDNYQTEVLDITCEDDESALEHSEKGGMERQQIEPFIWKLVLWTARGRLPQGTDLDMPFQLNGWPNFTRLVTTPYAFRIVAYWMNKPRTLGETLDDLGLEQRYVFSLYSAMALTNQVIMTGDKKQDIKPNYLVPDVVVKTRRLFGRLLKKLNTLD